MSQQIFCFTSLLAKQLYSLFTSFSGFFSDFCFLSSILFKFLLCFFFNPVLILSQPPFSLFMLGFYMRYFLNPTGLSYRWNRNPHFSNLLTDMPTDIFPTCEHMSRFPIFCLTRSRTITRYGTNGATPKFVSSSFDSSALKIRANFGA